MALSSSSTDGKRAPMLQLNKANSNQFFVWREFLWGGIAGAFGEGMMHPIDTVKTRIQSQAIFGGHQKSILQMVRTVWVTDGLKGFYRGIAPGVTGSLATGATYFGVIESTKKWIEESHPNLNGHRANFIAGAIGDTLGSFVYVPCEVMKQRMQVQSTKKVLEFCCPDRQCVHETWHANVWLLFRNVSGWFFNMEGTGAKGIIRRVTFYEALKDLTEYGKRKWMLNPDYHVNSSLEGLLLGGLAGGFSACLTTPLDVVKTRLQVQGSTVRIWTTEGTRGMFRGSIPRIIWYVPASALTVMAVEFLRDHFNEALNDGNKQKVASLSTTDKKKSCLQEVS